MQRISVKLTCYDEPFDERFGEASGAVKFLYAAKLRQDITELVLTRPEAMSAQVNVAVVFSGNPKVCGVEVNAPWDDSSIARLDGAICALDEDMFLATLAACQK